MVHNRCNIFFLKKISCYFGRGSNIGQIYRARKLLRRGQLVAEGTPFVDRQEDGATKRGLAIK